ncbi:MAG: PBP1A family penicillin-binding protein [Deltaproteobacteria bacterium]|nr:PBP1A family penicillin-binding protein [Deltaproteobacteria bacterium]
MNIIVEGRTPTRIGQLLRWGVLFATAATFAGGLAGIVAYVSLAEDVPNIVTLADYRPPLTTRIYGQEGQLIGEVYREKRDFVPYDRMPKILIQGVLASEDDRFFVHTGLDYWGIVRAAFANVRAMRVVQGGSTITQQVAKALLIEAEGYGSGTAKKLKRKVKEAILARRLERKLSKADILALYLNQIFFGNQAYGVEAAAQNYFRKHVEDLTVAEAALLAGLPQAPSSYSPISHPEEARQRREYVLKRMAEVGFITASEAEEARTTAIPIYRAANVSKEVTPFFTEHVRRLLVDRYGEKVVLEGGLTVMTSVDVERYRAAEDAAYEKLRMVDKRQGYQGPLKHLETAEEIEKFLAAYEKELERIDRKAKLEDRELYVGVVTKVDRTAQLMELRIGPHKAVLPLAAMRWARAPNPAAFFDSSLLNELPKSFKNGDVLLVRTTTLERVKKSDLAGSYVKNVPANALLVALEQEPKLETALMSVDVDSGYVLAMLGGYSFDRSEFNRAIQSCRQPGSSFKPIVYGAAVELLAWSPSTLVLDAPLTFDDPDAQRRWKPQNFSEKFLGEVTVRTAVQNSMNIPAVRTAMAVGLDDLVGNPEKGKDGWARRLGIKTKLPKELGVALGQGCVNMNELTEAYRLFAGGGARTDQVFITRVVDRDGKVLEDNGFYKDAWAAVGLRAERALRLAFQPPEQIIEPETAFIVTRLLRNVVTGGTGTSAQAVGSPVAGKTGTTNDSFDAWFVGFNTDIVTAAWVGYDDYVVPMGRYEQGGRAALPVWVAYMKKAIRRPTKEFDAPAGIEWIRIDPKTGLRAGPSTGAGVIEAYKRGNEPSDVAEAGSVRAHQLGKADREDR